MARCAGRMLGFGGMRNDRQLKFDFWRKIMKSIITIQHTQSVHHTNGMVGSWTDWELTELGVN